MKKIFTLFAALAMVMSMSAQTLYLRGDFNTWGTTNKLDADGNCKIELKVGNYGFKVADANWSNNYNFGSSATISETTTGVKFTKGSNDNCTLKATTAGVYTFKFNLSTLTLDVTYPQGEVVEIAPTVAVLGEFNGWSTTANILTNDPENKTATTVIKLTAGTTKFKVFEDSKWLGDNQTVTRAANSQVFGKVDGADCYLTADIAGDYVFTWTFESNTLVVTYPEAGTTPDPETPVEPEEPEVTYVLMGVATDWTTGIAMTQNPDNANEYVLLGQEIAEGDAVKVVTLTNGNITTYCGNVDEYSVAVTYDNDGNIVLAPGKYDFYYKVTENIVYIGATPSEEPVEPEEPTYEIYEVEINDLSIDLDNLILYGSASADFDVEVMLGLGESDLNTGIYQLKPESYVGINGSDATFVEGTAYEIDAFAPAAKAVVRCIWNGMNIELQLNMSAAPLEATVVVVENANVAIEKYLIFGEMYDYALKMTGVWTNEGVDYPVLVEVPVYYPEATEASTIFSTVTVGGDGDDDPWLGFGEGDLTIETVNGVVTATGVVQNPMVGIAIDITISGTLPQGPTGVDNINATVAPAKMIKNGQLIIRNNGVEFNAQGAIVK